MLTKGTAALKILIIAAIALFCAGGNLYAIGDISFGANVGATRDPNHLQNEIDSYNKRIEYYLEMDPDAEGSQIPVGYSFVWGFSFKYQFNFILFRLGSQFTRSVQKCRGSLQPSGGDENTIKISTYQYSIPFSIAFIVPFKEKTYFYIGVGLSYTMAYVKITQSDPAATSGVFPDTNLMNKYAQDFPGYHIIVGAEVPAPFSDRFTISMEWMHQEGRSHPLSNRGQDINGNKIDTPKKTINIQGDFILFGINYYISF